MPDYLTNLEIWKLIWPPLVLSGVISFIFHWLLFNNGPGKTNGKKHAWLLVFSLALFGIITGQIMGQSREPSVSAVIPAVLSLMSGALLFLFSKVNDKDRKIFSAALTAFIFTLFMGSQWGANIRNKYDENKYLRTELNKLEADFALRLQKCVNERKLEKVYRIEPKDPKDLNCLKDLFSEKN